MDVLGTNDYASFKKMKKTITIFGILVFLGLLVLVRAFEGQLFYDPLLHFFEMDYKSLPLPKMKIGALLTSVGIRYLLNTLFSLAILWLVFKDFGILKVSLWLYFILFAVLFCTYVFIIVFSETSNGHFVLFYVRRFLIQPLLLLVLIPAFYFQKYKSG